jgi:tRNA pseudouridine38-40 synthase
MGSSSFFMEREVGFVYNASGGIQSPLMTTTTLKCIVRYDGTNFAGWQRQNNARTVQGVLEQCLSRIADRDVSIQGAGRTDAGVHALGQVFSCRWFGRVPDRLSHAVSGMLSPEVRLLSVEPVAPSFNARFDAQWKRYVYAFCFQRDHDPFAARYAWHVPYAVDMDRFNQGLHHFIGEHDFAGFQSAGSQMKNTVRTLYSATLTRGGVCGPNDMPALWRLDICGNGFLYKMVRNICGTLVDVARGRFALDFIQESLERGSPFLGHCAPAHGLALAEVHYESYGQNLISMGNLP